VDGLDVVAVGVEQEGRVVEAAGLGAVVLAHTRAAVVAIAGRDPRGVEGVHLFSCPGDEADVDGRVRLI
jgi:hypothetical protein